MGLLAALDPGDREPDVGSDEIAYHRRGAFTDAEMVGLVRAHGRRAIQGWWDQIRAYSLGWVTARAADGTVIALVNVAYGYPSFVSVDAIRSACGALVDGDPEPLVSLMHEQMEWRGRRRLSRFWQPPPS